MRICRIYREVSFVKLSEVPVGASTVVKHVRDSDISPKLRAIGILPGVKVTVIKSAPMGDPRMYKVFNKIISLRQSEAELVEVDLLTDSVFPLSHAVPGQYVVNEIVGGFGIHRWLSRIGITKGTTVTLLPNRKVVTTLGTFDIGFGKLSKILVKAVHQNQQGQVDTRNGNTSEYSGNLKNLEDNTKGDHK